MKDRHGNEWVLVPVKATDKMTAAAYPVARMSARGAINHAIAAAPKFEAQEVTRPMCHGAWARFWSEPNSGDSCDQARRWLEAWRTELGPTLGLVTREELAARVESAYREGFQRGNVEMPDEDAGEYWLNSNARKQLEAK